jgi:hypothetical protein
LESELTQDLDNIESEFNNLIKAQDKKKPNNSKLRNLARKLQIKDNYSKHINENAQTI